MINVCVTLVLCLELRPPGNGRRCNKIRGPGQNEITKENSDSLSLLIKGSMSTLLTPRPSNSSSGP